MSGREPERRKRIKDALARLSEGDAGSRERERIGALIAILLSIFGIIAIIANVGRVCLLGIAVYK